MQAKADSVKTLVHISIEVYVGSGAYHGSTVHTSICPPVIMKADMRAFIDTIPGDHGGDQGGLGVGGGEGPLGG